LTLNVAGLLVMNFIFEIIVCWLFWFLNFLPFYCWLPLWSCFPFRFIFDVANGMS